MKTILVLSLKAEKGNTVFCKASLPDDREDCELVFEEADDSFQPEDICDLIEDDEADACLIHAGKGCCLFAARLALSLSALAENADVLVLSDELEGGRKYVVGDGSFTVLAQEDDLSRYLAGEEFPSCEAQLSSLPYACGSEYALAMRNGVIVSLSGLYPQNLSGTGKHVTMKNAEEFFRSAGKLHLAFNSAVLFTEERFDAALHERLLRVPGFTCHFHYACGDGNFTFDNSGVCTRIRRLPLSAYVALPEEEAGCTYLADLNTAEDFAALRALLSEFFAEGRLTKHNFWLTNECMFTSSCTLYKFFRYRVENQNLYPCGGAQNVGAVDTPPLKRMAALDSVRGRLGCDCVVMDGDFRKNYDALLSDFPNVKEYFLQKSFYHNLKLASHIFQSGEDIRVSNSVFSSLYQGASNADGAEPASLGLYRIGEKFFVFDPKKLSILTLDPKIALILEGGMKKATPADIAQSFQTVCHTDEVTAAALYEKGSAMLRKGGLL